MTLSYEIQPSPDGLAQALILGDNIFFGHGLPEALKKADAAKTGATVFGYHVTDPERYGVVGFDTSGRVETIVEKPKNPPSNYAVTGLYFVDETAPARTKKLTPSDRGELEITDLLNSYLKDGDLNVEQMGRGFAWLDTGTHNSLLDAGNFVRTLTERQGLQVGSPDEIAYYQGWIDKDQLTETANKFGKSLYGSYLSKL